MDISESLDLHSPVWNHIEELRLTLIRIFCTIGVGLIVAFYFYPQLFAFLTLPMHQEALEKQQVVHERLINKGTNTVTYRLPVDATIRSISPSGVFEIEAQTYSLSPQSHIEIEKTVSHRELAIFGPADGISSILKVCFWTALVGTSPFWLLFVLRFISPGLTGKEKKLAIPFLCLSGISLILGACFAYYITIPFANNYLWEFNATIGQNLWSLSNYLNFTLFLLFSNALAFEIALVFFMLVHVGILTKEWMLGQRRLIILGAFVAGALLTPPDILTQVMMAVLLIALYEFAILYARWRSRRSILLERE